MNKRIKKPLVVLDISTLGKGGGPFVNNLRIMESNLKIKYDFNRVEYKAKHGSGISLRRIFDLRKQLIELKPDIVHFSGLQLSGFHIAAACKLANISNIILTVHGFSGDALNFHPFKKILLTYFLEPLTILFAKKFYGVSKYVVSRPMIRLFNYKCDGVIYNFPTATNSQDKGLNIRKELGLQSEDVIVVSVARITKDKGYHILDEAILKLQNQNTLKFIIVGDGDYLEAMRKKLKEQIKRKSVFLLGYRNDIKSILSGCDIFILPTLHETLSIALLEASAEGLALIASNTGGIPEIVENGYNGLLVPAGCVSELVNKINMLLNDPILRNQFGRNARKRIKDKFSNRSIEEKIDAIYSKILGHIK